MLGLEWSICPCVCQCPVITSQIAALAPAAAAAAGCPAPGEWHLAPSSSPQPQPGVSTSALYAYNVYNMLISSALILYSFFEVQKEKYSSFFSVSNEKLNTIIIEKLLYLLIYNLVQFFKLNYNFQQKLFPFLCWRLRNDDKWSQNLCKTFNCGQGAWLEVVITQYIFSLVGRMDRADLFNTPPNQKSIN